MNISTSEPVITEKVIKSVAESEGVPFIPALMDLPLGRNKLQVSTILTVLEHYFAHNPNGFYMWYKRFPKHSRYNDGFCWYGLLRFNPNEIKLFFDQIGVRYSSYKEFEAADMKFGKDNKKYYCCYYDTDRRQAYYIRNHSVVEEAIKSVLGDVTVEMIYEGLRGERTKRIEAVYEEVEQRKQSGEKLTTDLILPLIY
jgi:hypothetical protein